MKQERDALDPKTGKPQMDAQGNPLKEIIEVERPAFKVATVFDISQTEGKELPSIGVNELSGGVEGYDALFNALKATCPVPIAFEDIPSGAKGYYHTEDHRIALQEGMSQMQTVKTLIHEMSHERMHSHEKEKPVEERLSRRSMEVEAESVAFVVGTALSAEHPELKLDFSDYSFGYIAGWSSGKETAELKASLGRIQATASEMISEIEGHLQELQKSEQLQAVDEIDQKAAAMEPVKISVVAEPSVIDKPSILANLHKEKRIGRIPMRRNRSYRRGDIFLADLGIPHGSEQGGRRPVIILQNDDGCLFSPTVTMVPLTTNLKKTYLKTHHVIKHTKILRYESMAEAEQINTIDKDRVIRYIGHLDPVDMEGVAEALRNHLGFDIPECVEAP